MQSLSWAVVLDYLVTVGVTTALHLFLAIGIGLILGFFIHFFSRAIQTYTADVLPFRLYTYLLWPGVVLHELAHWFFLKIFGYRIIDKKLFQPNRSDYSLGYVQPSAPRGYIQIVGGFFAGVGPLVVGSLAVFGLSALLLGPGVLAGIAFTVEPSNVSNGLETLGQLVESVIISTVQIFQRMTTLQGVPGWRIALFLYLTFAIVNAMNLSGPDLQHAKTGFLFLVGGLFVFNLATLWMGGDFLSPFFSELSRLLNSFYAMMLFTLCLDVIVAVVVVPLGIMFGRSAPR